MNLKGAKRAVAAGGMVLVFLFPQFSRAQASTTATTATQQTTAKQTPAKKKQSKSSSSSSSSIPNAPTPAGQQLSLQDLGFSQSQTQANPKLQARLERRTRMLKIHQRLGLITLAPMVADLITGPMAKVKGRNGQILKVPTTANLDLHVALGSLTTALYFTTASYAIFAPRIPGVKTRGAIRVHEALAWVHGPGMILTPILGAMAFHQEMNGEKPHGIAAAHGTVAAATAIAYGAAIIAIAWPIHLKFWRKQNR